MQQNYLPREEFTDINIHQDGSWYTKDKKITNFHVLKYFRSSLQYDDKGTYILNTFGQFTEKGYITINGPLMFVTSYDQDNFYLETKQAITLTSILHIIEYKDIIYIPILNLHGYAQISRKIYCEMLNIIVEKMSQLFFYNIPIKHYKVVQWSY